MSAFRPGERVWCSAPGCCADPETGEPASGVVAEPNEAELPLKYKWPIEMQPTFVQWGSGRFWCPASLLMTSWERKEAAA